MYAQSIALAKKVKYFSAGTIEYIVDQEGDFYFLEISAAQSAIGVADIADTVCETDVAPSLFDDAPGNGSARLTEPMVVP